MYYKIFSSDPSSHFIDIACSIKNINQAELALQLPSWRPGRYELQNFAKNIQKFEVFNANGVSLTCRKIKKDRWLVDTKEQTEIIVKYNYYAVIQNAGSSYVDEHVLYVNPVNLCIYVDELIDESCSIEMQLANNESVTLSEALRKNNNTDTVVYGFKSYYHLVDSPFIKSSALHQEIFYVENAPQTQFNFWLLGNWKPNFKKLIADFTKFIQIQIDLFGSFPEQDYHFITWVLAQPFYHGVEHRNSTMMVLGPIDDASSSEDIYTDLLGLASHELFHTWNICKIRPKELLPYDFACENYFSTCFVVEGITTYYGDLLLYKSGVFDKKQYYKELEACYKQHFEHSGQAVQSLAESSWDLWLDGYMMSTPNRRVSVYHKGAIVAQLLDLFIQKNTEYSLDDVMRALWRQFGKTKNGEPTVGYTLADFKDIAEKVAGCSLDWYFETCIFGNAPLEELLNELLQMINLKVDRNGKKLIELKTVHQS